MSNIINPYRFGGGGAFITATGGTVTTSGNIKIHTFTADGDFTVTAAPSGRTLDVLVVAGGGAGALAYNRSGNTPPAFDWAGGGGGAGGYVLTTGMAPMEVDMDIPVVVGAAGGYTTGTYYGDNFAFDAVFGTRPENGEKSEFGTSYDSYYKYANGGGRGSGYLGSGVFSVQWYAQDGGSGGGGPGLTGINSGAGGSGDPDSLGEGNDGADYAYSSYPYTNIAGGGGGAGSAGSSGGSYNNGGSGVTYALTDVTYSYGGAGCGGSEDTPSDYHTTPGSGGNGKGLITDSDDGGQDGVVIISYTYQ